MPVNARPNLENNFFKQLAGTTLTLSGQTKIQATSGLTFTDGSGNFIPIILSGGTSGDTLTYINSQMVLRPSGAGAKPIFNGCRTTTRSGIPVVNTGGNTVQQFLENYFFPSVFPSSSLSVATGDDIREYGNCSVGNLAWCVVKNTNNISTIDLSTDGTGLYNCSIVVVGTTQSGVSSYTYPFVCATPATGVTNTTVTFNLSAQTISGETTTSLATINWSNKRFYFPNATYYNTSAINPVLSGETGELSTTKTLATTMVFNNQFFYYAYPKVLGVPSFMVNGLPNNAWGNPSYGTLFTSTFINLNGYSNEYYVARSDNKITGSYIITVS